MVLLKKAYQGHLSGCYRESDRASGLATLEKESELSKRAEDVSQGNKFQAGARAGRKTKQTREKLPKTGVHPCVSHFS